MRRILYTLLFISIYNITSYAGYFGASNPNADIEINNSNPNITLIDIDDSNSAALSRSDTNGEFSIVNTVENKSGTIALEFTGGNDNRVTIPIANQYAFPDAFSISFWVKPASADINEALITSYDGVTASGFYCRQLNSGSGLYGVTIYASGGFTTLFSDVTPQAGIWEHFVFTRSSAGSMKLYINNSIQSNNPTRAGAISGDDSLYMGVFTQTAGDFSGSLDEVKLYNYELSSTSVTYLYNSGSGQYGQEEDGLVGGWHLDEGSGNFAYDFSSYKNTGTITVATFDNDDGVVASPGIDESFTLLTHSDGDDANEGGKTLLTSLSGSDYGRVSLDGRTIRILSFGSEKMRVDEEGEIGIGTTLPQSELHVEGTITADNTFQADDSDGMDFNTDDSITRANLDDNGCFNFYSEINISSSPTSTINTQFIGVVDTLPTSGYNKYAMCILSTDNALYISTEAVTGTFSWKKSSAL